MNYKFLIAVVATLAPLSLCQDLLLNPQLQQLYNANAQSQAQAQAQAQAQSQSNAILDQSNAQQLRSYLNAWQGGPPLAGVPVLCGAGVPGAASPIPAINPYAAQADISESLAQTELAAKMRQGAIQVVPPNLSSQAVLQSVHVPVQGRYSNIVYASNPLPPMVVSQPGSPPIEISSGPAAVVRADPVIYRQPPSVVYQNEVINRHPAPLSLNPVYVKVYKPGKKVIAPRQDIPLPSCQ